MASIGSLAIAYLLGGLTLFPILLISILLISFVLSFLKRPSNKKSKPEEDPAYPDDRSASQFYKVGWLKVCRDDQLSSPGASFGGFVKSYIARKKGDKNTANNVYFAVLKYTTLFLYDSEKQQECKGVIGLTNHSVSIHPPGLQDFELFSRPQSIKLELKDSGAPLQDDSPIPTLSEQAYYVNCSRCVDKEDWYFALRKASMLKMPSGGQTPMSTLNNNLHETTHFNQAAMNQLITTVHSDEHHFQTQWLNAMLGRLFFGVYKTEQVKAMLLKKAVFKIDKLNSQRPPFLGPIRVRSIDPGQSIPSFTQPRLLGLSPTGELTAEATMQYDGGFRIEIETVLEWKYSDRLPPLTVDIVLAITLKEMHGRFLMKIKEPPTNRIWYGFYEAPKMEWIVEPVVWDKQVGFSVVLNAIETKMQEIIIETMALPNMDDIVFFPTDGAGGIFGDAPDATPPPNDEKAPEDPVEPIEPSAPKETLPKIDLKQLKADEELLSTAKSLPELFSAVPDRHVPSLTPSHSASTAEKPKKRRWFAKDSSEVVLSPSLSDSVAMQMDKDTLLSTSPQQRALMNLAETLLNRKHQDNSSVKQTTSTSPEYLSPATSPTTALISIDDMFDSPSLSSSHGSSLSQEPLDIDIGLSTSLSIPNSSDPHLRKSASVARLRAKSQASTAISPVNVAPAMHQLRAVRSLAIDHEEKREETLVN
ncbi:putative integral membrane protein conserved region-domain-containing protein [Phycomyces nitens]|nr:putative integral membrane protein conserved region-domain-containing protein [Phycomyces nitens]